MKPNRTFILLGAAGLLVVSMLVLFDSRDGHIGERPEPSPSHARRSAMMSSLQKPPQTGETATEPARREDDLRQWADSVGLDSMEDTLRRLESVEDDTQRLAAYQALLSSWAERDLPSLAAWFGERYAADEIHQQTRDALGQFLAQCDPDTVLTWMEGGLPESVRQELEGPFFRAWAQTDSASAAAKLSELAGASLDDPRWSDLAGHVAALWAGMDLERAVAWAQSLENGPVKAAVLQAVGYRWTETQPRAAAAYAARQNDADLLRLVAGKWAEMDPRAAAAWAEGLPAGEARDGAIANLTSIWSQKDLPAAVAYAASLPAGSVRDQAMLAAASNWVHADPVGAAGWIGRFPEGRLRTQALEQLMSVWAGIEAQAAGQWLKALPASSSRDAAVAAYTAAMGKGVFPD